MRVLATTLIAAGAAALLATPSAAEPYTTRIETRAFYGATVTIEEGVRVIRPLPPQRHVIVNPDGLTPLSLGYTDVTERSYSYNETHVHGDGDSGGAGAGGLPFVEDGFRGQGNRGRRGRQGHRGHKSVPAAR